MKKDRQIIPHWYDLSIDFRNFLVNRYPEYNKDFGGILQETLMPDGDEVYDMNEPL